MAQAAGSAAAVALGAGGRDGEGGIRRIFAAQAGIHQFHGPKRETIAGTSRNLATVASRRMPTPTASPPVLARSPY
jgi:hypothetical protein